MAFGFDVLDRVEQAVAMVKERLKRAIAALEAVGFVHSFTFGINIFVAPALRPRLEEILANPEG